MPEYQSPGGAFSSAFEDTLLKQEQMKRQQTLDALTQQKSARDEQRLQIQDERAQAAEKRQQELSDLGKLRLAEDKIRFEQDTTDRQRTQFEKKMATRLPEDFTPPEDFIEAKRLGMAHLLKAPEPPTAPEPPSAIAAPGLPTPPPQSPAGSGVAAVPPMVARGTPQQRANVRFGQMGPTATLQEMQTTAHQAGLPDTAAEKAYGIAHPELKEKPPKPEADKDRYIQIQTDLKLGKPVPPEAKAWAAAYEQDKKLTVDTSGANAAARQIQTETTAAARQDKTEKFQRNEVGRNILTKSVETPYQDAVAKAALLKNIVHAAQGGNMVAGSMQSLVATLTTLTAEGIKRINTPEISTIAGAGSFLQRTLGLLGAQKEGQPLSPELQHNLLLLSDVLSQNAYEEYKQKHKTVTKRYDLTDEEMLPPPGGSAAPEVTKKTPQQVYDSLFPGKK